MNKYEYFVLLIAVIACTSFTTTSAAGTDDRSVSPRFNVFTPGKWVPSNSFTQKSTHCYREYICLPIDSVRFGRNVKIKSTKLQRRKSTCSGSDNTCQCKTAPPTLTCKIKFLKRR